LHNRVCITVAITSGLHAALLSRFMSKEAGPVCALEGLFFRLIKIKERRGEPLNERADDPADDVRTLDN